MWAFRAGVDEVGVALSTLWPYYRRMIKTTIPSEAAKFAATTILKQECASAGGATVSEAVQEILGFITEQKSRAVMEATIVYLEEVLQLICEAITPDQVH